MTKDTLCTDLQNIKHLCTTQEDGWLERVYASLESARYKAKFMRKKIAVHEPEWKDTWE